MAAVPLPPCALRLPAHTRSLSGLFLKAPPCQLASGGGAQGRALPRKACRLSPNHPRLPAAARAAAETLPPASSAGVSPRPAAELVDELLVAIKGTDRGASVDEATRERVNGLIKELEAQGMEEPLKSPLVFGEWDVAYTSSPTAAGGYYRGALGRALLKTDEMVQTLSPPNNAGNRVQFHAFSAIPGVVSLNGVFTPLDNKLVEVKFEPPQLVLGPWSFSYGGESKVQLAVIYLDERVRLGRGSRGSLFVFVRRT